MIQKKAISPHKPIENVIIKDIPWYSKRLIEEHKQRYWFCSKFIKNKIVIDIACGSGYGSDILANSGPKKVIGIDNNKENINYASKMFPNKKITYIRSDAHKLPLESSSADIIVSFETIEHLEKPKRFIKEIQRLLKPKGLLILSTPNRETSYEDNPFHLKEYTLEELEFLLSEFSECKYYGQRRVNKIIILFYKKLYKWISGIRILNIFSFILRFRPWERILITPIIDKADSNFLYFIFVCTK